MNNLAYIIRKVSAEAGFQSPTLNPQQRAALVDVINEAANELYTYEDLPVSLQECYVRATPNKELALPPFIGKLRAVRNGCTDYCTPDWKLHDMIPRYSQVEWKNQWKVWRIKGYSPIAIEWLTTAPGTITYPVIDATLTVTIVGQTDISNRAIDVITMDAISKPWIKTYNRIDAIFKNKVTDSNIVLYNADDTECSLIYADQMNARYMLVDVSQFPNWGCCACPDGTAIMEVLYKPRLNRMELDSDSFPVDGFEDVIILKTKQLLAEMQEGKESRALLMDAKAKSRVNQLSKDNTGTVKRAIGIKRSPFHGLFGNLRDRTTSDWQ